MSLSSHDSAAFREIVNQLQADDSHSPVRAPGMRGDGLLSRVIRRFSALVALATACVLFLFGHGFLTITTALVLLVAGSWSLHAPIGDGMGAAVRGLHHAKRQLDRRG